MNLKSFLACCVSRVAWLDRGRPPAEASAHAPPHMLGHLLGLGSTRAGRARVDATLADLGIASNRVRGEWTGVSLARWHRLVELLAEARAASTGSS